MKIEQTSKALKDLDQHHRNEIRRLDHENNDLRKKVSTLTKKAGYVDLFMEDSQELAIRAFLDYVFQKFYKVAKVNTQRRYWLISTQALTFVQQHKNEHLVFKEFNSHVVINTTLLQRLQLAKCISFDMSSATCHSSSPVKVAIAFQELHQFKKNQDLRTMFKEIFGMDLGDMVYNYDHGKRKKFVTTFTLWK